MIENNPTQFGCYSHVGKQNGTQIIQLSDDCFSERQVAHELFHSIGFYHEHARSDRDKYVRINEICIIEGLEDQFKIHPEALTYGLPYNPKSIMHYRTLDFTNGRCATITSKISGIEDIDLGSAENVTDLDIQKVFEMYNCKQASEYNSHLELSSGAFFHLSMQICRALQGVVYHTNSFQHQNVTQNAPLMLIVHFHLSAKMKNASRTLVSYGSVQEYFLILDWLAKNSQ